MGRSFGLAAYRALSRRTSDRNFSPSHDRPPGALIWIHAPEPESLFAVEDLAQRLCIARPGLSVLITLTDADSARKARDGGSGRKSVFVELVPSEHPDAVQAFWEHWDPDMGIWAWGRLRPNLLSAAHSRERAMILIDADSPGFDGRRDRWLPDFSRQLLLPFVAFMARSDAAVRQLEALGLPTERITLTPPLEAGGQTLPCRDRDLSDLSSRLRGRPVWLANTVCEAELPAILVAHREALRLSHRLLLILHLADERAGEAARSALAEEGFRFSSWTDGDEFDDVTQVLLVRDDTDLGLFYRASPITFMGGSLVSGRDGRNPFEAAALGSAVLYGPNVRNFLPFYSRLARAGAARIVRDEATLGAAVTQLLAPDRAAAMAHAGWDVASQGADLTDRVIALVQAVLDGELEEADARA